jgi:hypothetical protein
MKVKWDDEIPNMMGKIKNVPNHQSEHLAHCNISFWLLFRQSHLENMLMDWGSSSMFGRMTSNNKIQQTSLKHVKTAHHFVLSSQFAAT